MTAPPDGPTKACQECGGVIRTTGRGRPRKLCLECAPRKRPLRETATASCRHCLQGFETREAGREFCSSQCRYAARDERRKFACAECGGPIFRSTTNRPVGEAVCKPCQRKCGTRSQYDRGCRCPDCRRAKAEAVAKYLPATYRHHWITPVARLALYERDGWICQLCQGPVDPTVPTLHRDAPTLDHIEPRSAALVPDDRPSNLRTAHRGCNSARGNRVSA